MVYKRTTAKVTEDERAMVSQGRLSPSRMAVLEGLEAQGKDGATRDELVTLIGDNMPGNNPTGAVGRTLANLESDGHVLCIKGRYYLKECAPVMNGNGSNGHAPLSPNGGKVNIAPFVQKRDAISVSIYTSPRVYDDVIDVQMLIQERWLPVPLFENARICIGQSRPEWSPKERYYTDVEVIKLTHRGGKITEERPAPRDIVTIAPEE